jgi:hypothetical protein
VHAQVSNDKHYGIEHIWTHVAKPKKDEILALGFDSIQGLEINRLTINFGQINRLIDYNRLIWDQSSIK